MKNIVIIGRCITWNILILTTLLLGSVSCDKKSTEPVPPLVVAAPVFSPAGNTYTSAINVYISTLTPEAVIYYTTDGSTPTDSSTVYTDFLHLTESDTLKAIACKAGWQDSPVVTKAYTLTIVQTVATPTFNPPSGQYNSAQSVAITCSTAGANIHYTINGNDPTASSPVYWTPIPVQYYTTLKAIAFKAGYNESHISSAYYEINILPPDYGRMVRVQGGYFMMGSAEGYPNEAPVHTVSVNTFYIDPYELTQADYLAVMGSLPCVEYGTGEDYPVYAVSFYHAIEYCNRRSIMEGLAPCYSYVVSYDNYGTNPDNWPEDWDDGNSYHDQYIRCNWAASGYRMPSESEWEYAARGGVLTHHYDYSGSDNIYAVAWYADNYGGQVTHEVAQLFPNELGLYDMSGNVNERVWDYYDVYENTQQDNPHGPASGMERVSRGGGYSEAWGCHVSARDEENPWEANWTLGMRVCRNAP